MYNDDDFNLKNSSGIRIKRVSKHWHLSRKSLGCSLLDSTGTILFIKALKSDIFSTADIAVDQTGGSLKSTPELVKIERTDFCRIWQNLEAIYLRTNCDRSQQNVMGGNTSKE